MSYNPDYARKIEAALDLIRQRPTAIKPETCELVCFCAVKDEPYKLCFAKQPSGRFRLTECTRILRDTTTPPKRFGYVPASIELGLDQLEGTAMPCPWCGSESINFCRNDCGYFVCGGLMQGGVFHCRKSCGASWVGQRLTSLTVERSQPQQSHSPAPKQTSPIVGSSAPPANDRLLPGPGKSIVKFRNG